jgi:hypothetical protein
MNKKQIFDKLDVHYKHACELYGQGNVFGTFLVGSQNYQLHTNESDVDSKTIIIPSLNGIAKLEKPISTAIECEDGSSMEIKDIREFFKNIFKQNINFVETLFTDYHFITGNPLFNKFYLEVFVEYADRIARYDVQRSLKSTLGLAYRKLNFLMKPTEKTEKEIEKYGYRSKELYHIFRLSSFVKKYIKKLPYPECIVPDEKERIIRIKQEHRFPKEKVKNVAESFVDMIQFDVNKFTDENENVVDVEIYEKTYNAVEDMLKGFFNVHYNMKLFKG